MNPSDKTRHLLALAIAQRIRKNPEEAREVIRIILSNIAKLSDKKLNTEGDAEWLTILNTQSPEEIADILENESDECQRLRSNLRGYSVIPDAQRLTILQMANGLCLDDTGHPSLEAEDLEQPADK